VQIFLLRTFSFCSIDLGLGFFRHPLARFIRSPGWFSLRPRASLDTGPRSLPRVLFPPPFCWEFYFLLLLVLHILVCASLFIPTALLFLTGLGTPFFLVFAIRVSRFLFPPPHPCCPSSALTPPRDPPRMGLPPASIFADLSVIQPLCVGRFLPNKLFSARHLFPASPWAKGSYVLRFFCLLRPKVLCCNNHLWADTRGHLSALYTFFPLPVLFFDDRA